MSTAALVLGQLLQTCAPNVGERTMTAIVRVESGGNYLAIRDNDVNRTFSPVDTREAVAWAAQLLKLHHSIDLGIAQINSANLPKLGMSLVDAFDPCINVHGGATILSYDYGLASQRFGAGQFALRRAIGAYNTGSIFAGESYVNRILVAAGVRTDADVHVPDITSLGFADNALGAGPPIRPLPLDTPRHATRSVASRTAAQPAMDSAYAAPILVPLNGPNPAVGMPQPSSPSAPIMESGVEAAPRASGNAPILVPVASSTATTAPAPASTGRPGLTISQPFGAPVALKFSAAAVPVLLRSPGADVLPTVAARPTVLVNMTLLPSPSPAATTKSQ